MNQAVRLLALAAIPLLAAGKPATPSTPKGGARDVLRRHWNSNPRSVDDRAWRAPEINGHSESHAVRFKDQWLLFHRWNTGVNPSIGVSTSKDGNAWKREREVVRPGEHWFSQYAAYAPKVLNTGDRLLTMVYEAAPLPVGTSGCHDTPKQLIAIADSTDGRVWKNHRVAVRPRFRWDGFANGKYCGNDGTPTINKGPKGFYVGFHGFNGEGGGPPRIHRAVATARVSDPRKIDEETLERSDRPMTFTLKSNGEPVSEHPAFEIGIGASDVVPWVPDEKHDGEYFMILELFAGSPLCDARTRTAVTLARAATPEGPWVVQDDFLLPQKQGCWRDMPSFQYQDGRYKVLLTDKETNSLNRIILPD